MSTNRKGFITTNLHSDRSDKPGHGALHKPIHTSVAFEYEDVHDLVAVFQGRKAGYNYGRQQNPTITALQNRVNRMEQGLVTVAFATGMAAIGSTLFSLLRQGDHIVCSAFLFGNSNSLFNSFRVLGVDVSFVDATDASHVAAAIKDNTRMVFVETIANPVTQIADMEGIGRLCQQRGLVFIVDNTMTTPWLFTPRDVGATLVINALTKNFGGHGNALGGSVTDTGLYDWATYPNIYEDYKKGDSRLWGSLQIKKKGLRDFGATLGPEAAHHLAVGSETLPLRVDRACANAQRLAEYLAASPLVRNVFYPGLANHPQHTRAKALFRHCGSLLSFDLIDSIDCLDFLNRLECVVASSNLGDTRTLAIPVAHTIYYEMGAERRASMGIPDSLIRLSVGIEDGDDLLADFEQAFAASKG